MYVDIIIPPRIKIEPIYTFKVIISSKKIYAIINTLGAYIVATIAEKLDPIFFNESKKSRSATPTPIIPLMTKIIKLLLEKFGIWNV